MAKRVAYTYYIIVLAATILAATLVACSTTSGLPDDEVLYTGIKSVSVDGKRGTYAESVALDEVNAALAYAPNASFMGSSSVRSPLPIGLWVYNAFVNNQRTVFNKWMFNSFASEPVTISRVSPRTRAQVATNLLQNYGYMNGSVGYSIVNQRNPRKQKIAYDITLGTPFVYDSIRYDFPNAIEDSILRHTIDNAYLKPGGQFSTYDLASEKTRLVDAFHDNGFYYYRPDYINYLADTINHPKHVSLLVQQDKDTPERAQRQYHVGNVSAYINRVRRNSQKNTISSGISARSLERSDTISSGDSGLAQEALLDRKSAISSRDSVAQPRRGARMRYDDSLVISGLKIAYQGDHMPIKPRVMFKNFRFWRGHIYNQSRVNQTLTNLHNMNIFSNVRLTFTPRDTTATCDTLDVRLDATMDKLIDAEFDFNITQKSNSQVGPHLGVTFSKRNAFRHGERLSVGLKSSYEWQTVSDNSTSATGDIDKSSRRIDSYEVGLNVTIAYPWIAFPWLNKKFYRLPTSSEFSFNIDHLNRSSYFRTVTSEVEAKYNYQTGRSWTHEFTPLSFAYRNILHLSGEVQELMDNNAYIRASMQEQLIPAMRYTVAYDNTYNTRRQRTTHLEFSVKESANWLNGINYLLGFDYDQNDKKLLGTPYSQFLKAQATLKNHFKLTKLSEIATRVQLGTVWSFGNSAAAPLSELFYVGGANSVRAFAVRSIGPGSYHDGSGLGAYVYQTGDFKLEMNAEYRFPIVSNLYGALFLDAGNVWIMRTNEDTFQTGAQLTARSLLDEIALGTGLGFRYDLEFLVLRLDCGIGIHAPYDTGKRGYYNIRKFTDGLGIHFAVGYPF